MLEQASIYKRAFPYRSCHKLIFAFSYYCFKSTFARLSFRWYRGSTSIEILGPYGISYTFQKLAKQINELQSGFVYHYAFVMLIGLIIFIIIIGMWDFISFWVDNQLYFIYIVSFLFIHLEKNINTN